VRAAPLLLFAALWACSTPPDERGDAAAADLGTLDTTALDLRAPDRGPTPDLPPPDTLPWCSLSGTVVDLSGKPLAGAAVAVCGSACWPATTDSKGVFSLSDLPAETVALDVRGSTGMAKTLGVVVFSLTLTSGQHLALKQPVGLPDVGQGTVLGSGAQAVTIDAALTLTVDRDKLTYPWGINSKYLAGARVPQAYWPPFALTHGGASYKALAMWALAPFDVRVSAPMELSIDNSALGLSAGAKAGLFVVVAKTGLASWAAEATVSADGKLLQTAAGQGLDRVTWLIVGQAK
jgi:hypothetical protein